MANDPTTKELTPQALASQLFDAALIQYKNDPREAVRRVIIFLQEALVFAIGAATPTDEVARKALLKNVGESIIGPQAQAQAQAQAQVQPSEKP